MIKKIVAVVLVLIPLLACAEQSLEKSVDAYCELYNPASWKSIGENASVQEVYGYILLQQEKTIINADLKSALNKADTSDFSVYFYSVKASIESLLDKPWKCEYFENFYLPKQSVISLRLGERTTKRIDPNADDVLTIMLAADGTILVGNAPLVSSTPEVIKKALLSKTENGDFSKINVVVYFDAGADGSLVAGLFSALSAAGIKRVDLIDYQLL